MTFGKAVGCRPAVGQYRLRQTHGQRLFFHTFVVLCPSVRQYIQCENEKRTRNRNKLSCRAQFPTHRYAIGLKFNLALSGNLVLPGPARLKGFHVRHGRRQRRQDGKLILRRLPFRHHVHIPILDQFGVRVHLQTVVLIAEHLVRQRASKGGALGLDILKGHETDLVVVRTVVGTLVGPRHDLGHTLANLLSLDRVDACRSSRDKRCESKSRKKRGRGGGRAGRFCRTRNAEIVLLLERTIFLAVFLHTHGILGIILFHHADNDLFRMLGIFKNRLEGRPAAFTVWACIEGKQSRCETQGKVSA